MKKIIYVFLICIVVLGCTDSSIKKQFNTVVTFPVNDSCHEYVSNLENNNSLYEMEYRKFTIMLDAFPQISGFLELQSNGMMNLELQNEAIKIMDQCFARAKTTIAINTPKDWIKVGEAVEFNRKNKIPMHSLILKNDKLDINYNWSDREKSNSFN